MRPNPPLPKATWTISMRSGCKRILLLAALLTVAAGCESSSQSSSEPWTLEDDASVDAAEADAPDASPPQVHRNVCGLEEPEDRGWLDMGDGVWRRDLSAFVDGCGRYQLSVQFELSKQIPDVVLDYQVCNTCDEERVLDVGTSRSAEESLEIEHVERPRRPFVTAVLWDSQGRQYPIPCEEYAFMSTDDMQRYVGTVRRTRLAPHEGLSSEDRYVITRFAMSRSSEETGIGGNYEPVDVEDPELRIEAYWAPLKPAGASGEEAATFDQPAFCGRAGIPVPIIVYDVDFERFPLQAVGSADLPDAYFEAWD